MIGKTAQIERDRIVSHIRQAAAQILSVAIYQPDRYDLKTAEIAATAMEETAIAIETGDHWKALT